MRETKYLEQQIDEITYPAKLPLDMKRYLASKHLQLRRSASDERQRLQTQLNSLQATKRIPASQLKRKQVAALKRFEKAKADAVAAQKAVEEYRAKMRATGLHEVYTAYEGQEAMAVVQASEQEYNKAKQRLLDALEKVKADEQANGQALRQTALELAEAQVQHIQNRIAKLSPSLAKALEDIGTHVKALPPAEDIDADNVEE